MITHKRLLQALLALLLFIPAASCEAQIAYELSGTAEVRGLPHSARLIVVEDGRFRLDVDGPLGFHITHDGTHTWRQFGGAPAQELQLVERDLALFSAWLTSGYWQAGGAPLERAHGSGGAVQMRLRDDLLTAIVSMAPGYRPTGLRFRDHPGQVRIGFSGELEVNNRQFPSRITFFNAGPAWPELAFDTAEALNLANESMFDRPTTDTADHRFSSSLPERLDFRRIASGHTLIRPQINGQDFGWFLFDTGGVTTIVSSGVVESLGLQAYGESRLGGVGGLGATTRAVPEVEMTLGPLVIHNLPVQTSPGDHMTMISEIAGEPVVGVIGWDLLIRSLVTLDMESGAVEIADPAYNRIPEDIQSDLILHWRTPFIPAIFEGEHQGLFMLDTGAGGSGVGVIFPQYTVERLNLLEDRDTSPVDGHGAGGTVAMQLGSLDWLEVAGQRREAIPAAFSTEADNEGDPYSLGILGAAAFDGLSVQLDYANGLIAVVPIP